ncbi:MAG: hypothetical protein A2309_01640 [Bacteroidetes bacterium RIFOXYB2_FULL_35_7]|nr:MAG: hypothetical protein A2309_01640 [Bacteroidetes bacterium RIFOXYB2_FULL_35_7]OFY97503.1 MAG: hypothetical protein A2491_00415 [Bacteroidetes bacterium RIFOXYC12_FULL_35_7]
MADELAAEPSVLMATPWARPSIDTTALTTNTLRVTNAVRSRALVALRQALCDTNERQRALSTSVLMN